MENQDLQFIQAQIGYNFKNTDLLQQAFVRRSYAKENGGPDNEILEFIGDKVLDIIVVKILMEKFGYMTSDCDDYDIQSDYDEFYCEYSEGKLTHMKKQLVEKKMLSYRIDMLGLSDYLIMGKGDIHNHVEREESVKEDLFEAIIGAVTLDLKWNFSEIQNIIEVMLDSDSYLSEDKDDNYVEMIQDWNLKRNKAIPLFCFNETGYITCPSIWNFHFNVISQTFGDNSIGKYYSLMKLSDDLPIFKASGNSKSKARKAVCKLAYDYLEKNDLLFSIQDEIENPNKAEAINQLETLARRGYFSIPTYDFNQEYDEYGNPIWKCKCYIKEYNKYYQCVSSSKKDAKKSAAFKMLKFVLKYSKN